MEEIVRWSNLQKVLGEYGEALRNEYQDNLIRDNKIASGKLLNSIEYEVQFDERAIWLQFRMEDYYKWVENGRGPGKFPPPDKILEWIRIKPIIPDDRMGTGKLPTEKQLSFLIGRKIAEEGIEPGNQLHKAIETEYENWEARIDEAIALDVNESLEIIFSSFFKN